MPLSNASLAPASNNYTGEKERFRGIASCQSECPTGLGEAASP